MATWGADSVRCNIGGGSICSTRIQTGHGVPGLQTIIECAKTEHDVTIIADGGIKNSGDIVKALAAGADAVMVGSMLAGTAETPGDIYKDNNGVKWKTYRGMASKDAQINWRGKYASLESVSARVPYRGTVKDVLSDIERGIRSGFSYSGARNMIELWTKSEFIVQTNAGMKESQHNNENAMSTDISYGKLSKRIVFTENDHRHAQLVLRLKHDGLKQSEFFRSLITGYISGDERIISYINEFSNLSSQRKKSNKLRQAGTTKMRDFGFTDGEIEDIFDLIEGEHRTMKHKDGLRACSRKCMKQDGMPRTRLSTLD